jgi:hypothetical protein
MTITIRSTPKTASRAISMDVPYRAILRVLGTSSFGQRFLTDPE